MGRRHGLSSPWGAHYNGLQPTTDLDAANARVGAMTAYWWCRGREAARGPGAPAIVLGHRIAFLLRRILADRFGQPQAVWLCAHPELRRSASMRLAWDRLERALRRRLARATAG